MTQGCVETKSQERNQNMGFDSLLQLVKDRSHSQIAFEIFERFLDLGQQDIKLPELSGIFAAQIGAKQIAAFPLTNLAQFIPAQVKGKFSVLTDLYFNQRQPDGYWLLAAPSLRRSVSRAGAICWSSLSRAQSFLSWRRRIARSFATRSLLRAKT